MSATHLNVPVPVPYDGDCAIRDIVGLVGSKWNVLVVILLGQRTYRFNELHRSIEGISQRILTLTLRLLVRDGLITRTAYATVPPRVDYALTDIGRTLLEPLTALDAWATTHQDAIRSARRRHDTAEAHPAS